MRQNLLSAAFVLSGNPSRRRCLSLATSMSTKTKIENPLFKLINEKNKVLILDGGTGEELFRNGVPDDRKIWSASAVVSEKFHPILQNVHRSFCASGSDIITTNSYGIIPGVGFSRVDIQKYIKVSGKIAFESSLLEETPNGRPLVFGSLGPLVESYRPDLVMDHDSGVEFYEIMARSLSPYVDFFLAETMSSVEESSQVVDAVSKIEETKPVMISFTVKGDGALRSGENVIKGIQTMIQYAKSKKVKLYGILFNCSEPESITIALKQINSDEMLKILKDEGVVLGAYANRLTPIADDWTLADSTEPQAMRNELSPREYFKFISLWVKELNVQIVGGCCGITPEHISYIKEHLPS